MVQMSKVPAIHDAWVRSGNPLCAHETFDKEYHLGSDTGDYVCMTCGASWRRGADKPAPEPQEADQP
jgi:hypothetical protein